MSIDLNIISRDFFPDNSPVAGQITELTEDLASSGFNLTVYCGKPFYYYKGNTADKRWEGIRIRRIWTTNFDKDIIPLRLINELIFSISLFLYLLFTKPRLSLSITLPVSNQLVMVLLKKIRGLDYVIINYETIPELLSVAGKLHQNSFIFKSLNYLNKKFLNHAKKVISIGDCMSSILKDKMKDPSKLVKITNWADRRKIYPLSRKQIRLIQGNGLLNKFIVAYNGNVARYMDFNVVIEAAERLLPVKEISFVFVGNMTKKKSILEQIERRNLDNISSFDYLSWDEVNESCNIGDVGLVPMNRISYGVVVPSKIYTYMAARKPVIGITRPDTELAQTIRESRCGFIVEPEDSNGLAQTILRLFEDRKLSLEKGLNGFSYFLNHFDRNLITREYVHLLNHLANQ